MSIQNRKIKEGQHPIAYETVISKLLAKVYCFFKGHKPVEIRDEKVSHHYCICCWKKLDGNK